jgi:hypothetical protein
LLWAEALKWEEVQDLPEHPPGHEAILLDHPIMTAKKLKDRLPGLADAM